MKFRSTKASGSFDCSRDGSFELLVHMEADPNTLSYAEFDFETALPARRAREFADHAAYILRHRVGVFVVAAEPSFHSRSSRLQSTWNELDGILARRSIWLLSATSDDLRREPRWSNALEIARCAQVEVDPSDQARVVAYLTAVGRAPLRECMKLCASSIDSFDAVLRLVSAGVLFLDPPDDLSPRTGLRLDPPVHSALGWLPNSIAITDHRTRDLSPPSR